MQQDNHRLNFDLSVQFDTPLTHWHATLVPHTPGQSSRLEFDNPLELARHLINLTPTEAPTEAREEEKRGEPS